MKTKMEFFSLGTIALLAACASEPITLAPVGPNPLAGVSSSIIKGQLQVFSSLEEQNDDGNQDGSGGDPSWNQHTDYNVYDSARHLVEHVGNTTGHYSTSPPVVSLQPGNYTIRAKAKEWLSVNVPVVIQQGRTTRVHLDDQWAPPAGTPKEDLVTAAGGHPVGWSAKLAL